MALLVLYTSVKKCVVASVRREKSYSHSLPVRVEIPYSYAANLAICVDLDASRLHGWKTHYCHILLQGVLENGLRGIEGSDVREAIAELSSAF